MATNAPAHLAGKPWKTPGTNRWTGDLPALGMRAHPEAAALHLADRDLTVTWAELDRRADAFVAQLRARGIAPGDRIAWLGKNSDLFFVALFGSIRAGVVLVSVNWRLAVPEIAYVLGDSGARLLLRDPELVTPVAAALATLPTPPAVLPTEVEAGSLGLRALLDAPAPPCSVPHEADQPVLQLYTSGTTGMPKGVLLTHACLSGAARVHRELDEWVSWPADSVSINAMPNFHIAGVAWPLIGLDRLAPVVLTADPSPPNVIRLVKRYGARHTFVVPTIIRGIVDELRARPDPEFRMNSVHYGAAPIGESLLVDAMRILGCEFAQHFGMTEATGSCTFMAPSEHDPKRPHLLRSIGRPLPGCEIQVRSPDDGRLLARGESGEIWVKSPLAMLGYWNQPAKTAEALVDGWYRSGDGGYMDDEGFLYLTDRIKDMIISGGENIYPNEVEEALRQHPSVLDAGVIGLPDDKWGESVAALVELRPDQDTVTEDELRGFVRERIAHFKSPKAIHFGALPRTASGKVQRANIRKTFKD